MTGDRGDGRPLETLEVPVGRVGGPRDGDRRARLAAVAVVAFAVGVVAVAMPRDSGRGTAGSPGPSAAAVAPVPSPTPSGAPVVTGRPPRTPRPAAPSRTPAPLPSIASEPLPEAPRVAFYRRAGDDVEILVWTPGETDLAIEAVIEDALSGIGQGEPMALLASPDGRSVFVQSFGSFDTRDPSPVRVASADDGIVWDGASSSPGGGLWSVDSRWFVFARGVGRWTLVDTAADPPAVAEIEAVADRPAGSAAPGSASQVPTLPQDAPIPYGFSRDGRWLYGIVDANQDAEIEATIRVSLATGAVEAIDGVPPVGPESPAVADLGVGLASRIDPHSGRTIVYGSRISGDSLVTVREPDGMVAFTIEAERYIQGVAWVGDGRLAVVDGGTLASPTNMRLYLVDPDGVAEPDLLALDDVTSGGLVMHRAGYAVLAISIEPGPSVLLIMVRLADGLTSTLRLAGADVIDVLTVGWLG